MMARYRIVLVYDGTDFNGFQRQERTVQKVRTVQGVVEAALRKIGWQGSSILGAGRTDSGVHALGQVAAFDLDWAHSLDDLQAALNANLPPDAAVQQVNIADPAFHPRYDALARRYRYRIFCQSVRHPLRERYAWRVWPAVELEILQDIAHPLMGTHDFAAFGTPPRSGGSTIREVFETAWHMEGDELIFEVTANAFLYHMVRRMVSTQISIAQGMLAADTIQRCLEEAPPTMIQGLAPPQGLALVEVVYSPANLVTGAGNRLSENNDVIGR